MIGLVSVSKTVVDEKRGAQLVFHDLTANVPTNRRVAILSEEPRAATSFLHLLAGSDIADRGRIERGAARPSPIVHGGASLLSQLTGLENIGFFARLHGVESRRLIQIVDATCRLGARLTKPVRLLELGLRTEMEAALVAALGYDCYLIDRLHELSQESQWRFLHVARERRAGMIFTTKDVDLARRFGESFVVLRDHGAQAFDEFDQAVRFHERKA